MRAPTILLEKRMGSLRQRLSSGALYLRPRSAGWKLPALPL